MCNFFSLWHVLFLKRSTQLCYTGSVFVGRLDRRNAPITQRYRSGRRRDRRIGIAIAIARTRRAIASCRLQIGCDLLTVYGAGTSSDSLVPAENRDRISSAVPSTFNCVTSRYFPSANKSDRVIPKARYNNGIARHFIDSIANFMEFPTREIGTRNSGFLARHEVSRETKRSFSSSLVLA